MTVVNSWKPPRSTSVFACLPMRMVTGARLISPHTSSSFTVRGLDGVGRTSSQFSDRAHYRQLSDRSGWAICLRLCSRLRQNPHNAIQSSDWMIDCAGAKSARIITAHDVDREARIAVCGLPSSRGAAWKELMFDLVSCFSTRRVAPGSWTMRRGLPAMIRRRGGLFSRSYPTTTRLKSGFANPPGPAGRLATKHSLPSWNRPKAACFAPKPGVVFANGSPRLPVQQKGLRVLSPIDRLTFTPCRGGVRSRGGRRRR